MKLYNKIFLICIVSLLLFGCNTKSDIEFLKPELITLEPSAPYNLDLDRLDGKLDELVSDSASEFIYVRIDDSGDINEVSSDSEANAVLFNMDNFSRYGDLIDLLNTYREISISQETLINTKIDTINSLKELNEMNNQKIQIYYNLWTETQVLYDLERKHHRRDNITNKILLFGSNILFIIGNAL